MRAEGRAVLSWRGVQYDSAQVRSGALHGARFNWEAAVWAMARYPLSCSASWSPRCAATTLANFLDSASWGVFSVPEEAPDVPSVTVWDASGRCPHAVAHVYPSGGVRVVVFPEGFASGHPSGMEHFYAFADVACAKHPGLEHALERHYSGASKC